MAAFCVVAAGQRNRREQTLGGDADSQQRRTGRGCATGCAETYRMVLSVRRRIHCGIGRFCFCFFPKMRLILNDLWDGCGAATESVRELNTAVPNRPGAAGFARRRSARWRKPARSPRTGPCRAPAGSLAKADSASSRRAPCSPARGARRSARGKLQQPSGSERPSKP